MRIEKGHVAGNELNGQTTARDLGLGKMMSSQEGLSSAGDGRPRRRWSAPDRPVVVGFRPVDKARRLRAGAHFIRDGRDARTVDTTRAT